jgi:hypothetical protein
MTRDSQSFSAWAAALTGMSERSVERYAGIGERLAPTAIDWLRGTPFASIVAELEALSKLPEHRQRQVAVILARAEAPPASVRAALAEIEGRAVERDVDDAHLAKLLDAWARAGAKARRAFLEALRERGEIA